MYWFRVGEFRIGMPLQVAVTLFHFLVLASQITFLGKMPDFLSLSPSFILPFYLFFLTLYALFISSFLSFKIGGNLFLQRF